MTTAKDVMAACPPCSRNHLAPTAGDTPAIRAASSLERPAAIACQNGRRSARCRTGGRPGDLIFSRPTRTFFAPIVTSIHEVLRRPVEFTLYTKLAIGTDRVTRMLAPPGTTTVGPTFLTR